MVFSLKSLIDWCRANDLVIFAKLWRRFRLSLRPWRVHEFSPSMTLIALGINHQTAPIALRERLALDTEQALDALNQLRQKSGVDEVAILSTCNRTELYVNVQQQSLQLPRDFLNQLARSGPESLDEFFYQHQDSHAVRHLFRVATGLDSLVLGEPQILGQVKDAYQLAHSAHTLGSPMERLFQNTFAIAKKVRSETKIGAQPVSVAFAAVKMMQQIFADLKSTRVLLLGAGDTIELTAKHLTQVGVTLITVANRTLANAQVLAHQVRARAATLDELEQLLAEADVVIASTASRVPLISVAMTKSALKARKHRPIFMLDLAVPRDIEADVAKLEDVYLYTVDDLGQMIESGHRSRLAAAREAEVLIEMQVDHYMRWMRAAGDNDALKRLRKLADQARDESLQRAQEMLIKGRDPKTVLDYLAHTLTNKILHNPMRNLREAALRGDANLREFARQLYEDNELNAITPQDRVEATAEIDSASNQPTIKSTQES